MLQKLCQVLPTLQLISEYRRRHFTFRLSLIVLGDDDSARQFLGAKLDFIVQFALDQSRPEFLEFVSAVV
jgi:hypothetical protein